MNVVFDHFILVTLYSEYSSENFRLCLIRKKTDNTWSKIMSK